MTLDRFPLSEVYWTSLVCFVPSAWISLTDDKGFQSEFNSNPNDQQLLFWGCLPPLQSLLMGNIFINLTGLSRGIAASYVSEDYRIIFFQPAIIFPCGWGKASSLPENHPLFKPGCTHCWQTAWYSACVSKKQADWTRGSNNNTTKRKL